MLKAAAFDFDGVILESVDIKTKAFRELFRDQPEQVERIVELHKKNPGVSRYQKFSIIYRDMLKRPLDDSEMNRLDKQFGKLVYDEIMRCPFVPGALEFLQKHSDGFRFFIASATPEEEMRLIVKDRGLARFFRGVFGSPRTKAEILRAILAGNDLRPAEMVFIGDARSDYLGARDASIPFIGRVPVGSVAPFPDAVSVVGDLHELEARWSELHTHGAFAGRT